MSGKKEIRAVVFDFGGVIMSYSLVSRMIEEMSLKIGIPTERFLEGKKELWTRFEKCFALMKGEMTAREFEETIWIEAIDQVYGIKVTEPIRWLTVEEKQKGTLINRSKDGQENEGGIRFGEEFSKLNGCMISLLRDLRKNGYKTALLSNCFFMNAKTNQPILPIDYDLYFDVVIESCQVGTHKPNRDIFELMQSKLANLGVTDPQEVLFLDDLPEYCAGANVIGWNTIQVQSPERAVEEVRKLLDVRESAESLNDRLELPKVELSITKTITEIGI